MEKPNIGVIGLGAIGQKHCSAIAVLERAKLCAVADINEKVLTSTAAQLIFVPSGKTRETSNQGFQTLKKAYSC